MSTFDDRERAFETKYARDQEMQFKIVARRNRLLGQWAARLMGLTEAEADAYAKEVVRADFEEAGDDSELHVLVPGIFGLEGPLAVVESAHDAPLLWLKVR